MHRIKTMIARDYFENGGHLHGNRLEIVFKSTRAKTEGEKGRKWIHRKMLKLFSVDVSVPRVLLFIIRSLRSHHCHNLTTFFAICVLHPSSPFVFST